MPYLTTTSFVIIIFLVITTLRIIFLTYDYEITYVKVHIISHNTVTYCGNILNVTNARDKEKINDKVHQDIHAVVHRRGKKYKLLEIILDEEEKDE